MRAVGQTRTRALAEAQRLLQSVGFNGFSFQHIADALGIKKPSLYEHFKSKDELGAALIEEYRTSFLKWTETIDVFEPDAQIGALFEVFAKFVSEDKRVCPLAAMGGDFNSFPKHLKKALAGLYDSRRSWLVEVIRKGQRQKVFRKDKSAEELAELVLSIGVGAQFAARVAGNPELIREMKRQALDSIRA